jgi:Icc-related predicted phosphoesterase
MNGVSLRALVLSDLHYETDPIFLKEKLYPPHDVVIIAGDFNVRMDEIIDLLKSGYISDKPVIFTPGNHEYYYHNYTFENSKARWAARDSIVCLGLGEEVYFIGDTKFIACTMWTDFCAHGVENKAKAMKVAADQMNDYKLILIRDDATGKTRRLTPEDTEFLHVHEVAWIENHLRDEHDGPVVVVTHHSPGSLDDEYDGEILNAAFTSPSVVALIEQYQPALWVHGHQHRSFDYQIGETRVLSNPKGYGPFAGGRLPENKEFVPDLVIEIPYPSPKPSFGV